jgi:hypothetical protein
VFSVCGPLQEDIQFSVVQFRVRSNASAVALRVVGGDEKESLESETVKYGR